MKFQIKSHIFSTQFLLIGFITRIFCNVCPAPDSISPCVCNEKISQILCSGRSNIDLNKVFKLISDNGGKHFDSFVLTNSAITSLEDNVFSGISFKTISITGARSLTKISRMALNSSAFTLEEFNQKGENLLTDEYVDDLFDALSVLVSLNRLFLQLTKATQIPDNAFKVINGRQTKLETIHLNYIGGTFGSLRTIGNKAFYVLDNLRDMSLANQPIDLLKAHSFDFERPSTVDFDLHLEATKINSSSFESGIFLNSKRPMTVEMSNNQLDYLDEKVFKPILELPKDKMISFIVQNNPFVCDCKMYWLRKGKGDPHNYVERVMEPNCINSGDSIFDKSLNSTAFSKCL